MSKDKQEPTQAVAKTEPSKSERFTNAVLKELSATPFSLQMSAFQRKLCQNYFIKIDQVLSAAETKRLAKSEQYRDPLPLTWANVNMNKLAIDVLAFSSVGLDPTQPNHISPIPYKNNSAGKYDITFIVGYAGLELKNKKYGLDVPDDFVCELVYTTDKFKQIKKDLNNKVEGYTFEIVNEFERGEVVGGFWYHIFFDKPEKNKLTVLSLKDIEKRKPKNASAEFWGGEKVVYKNNQKAGTEKVDGWFEEMCLKTIKRHCFNSIVIDASKIDASLERIIQVEKESADVQITAEISEKANKVPLDFEDAQHEEIKNDPAAESKEEQTEESNDANNGPGF